MAERIQRFEDLIAWQKARAITSKIYHLTNQGEFVRDYGLKDQIRRACVSIMSNLAEGFERGSSNEFHQYIVIAKASCAEVRSQLYIAADVGHITQEQFHELITEAEELSKIIGGLRSAVAKTRK